MNQLKQIIIWLCASLCLILSGNVNAQEKELFVQYDLVDKSMNGKISMELLSKGQVTLSTAIRKMTMGGAIYVDKETGSITKVEDNIEEVTSKYHVFKDSRNDLMVSVDLLMEKVFVKESLNLFHWELTSEKDSILGYECQQAKVSFRGRDYTLWFTTALPFKAAPWKFHGLPGVVLKASSGDNFFKAEAVNLKIRNSKTSIENPYAKEEKISWEDFKKEYIKKDKELMDKLKANAVKRNMPLPPFVGISPKKEIILEKNRYGIEELMNKAEQNKFE